MEKKYLKIELADTPSLQERGLMFRKSLDFDSGMLFKFSYPQKLKFWGKNTYLPLAIAFVNPDQIIEKIDYISPLSDKCVCSDTDCKIAIEANFDFFEKNKIRKGSKIDLIDDKNDGKIVIFKES